jgi:hypothetical protein
MGTARAVHFHKSSRPRNHLLIFAMVICLICMALFLTAQLMADPVTVRLKEGLLHGFLVMRTADGDVIAGGDLTQTSMGDRVTDRLVFHFKDGSVQDETTTFTQDRTFRLVKDRLIQRGPTFKQEMDATVDGETGWAVFKYAAGSDGKPKVVSDHLQLPPDVSNGMVLTLLENLPVTAKPATGSDKPANSDKQITVSMVVPTPKPRLVKLIITRQGTEKFDVGGTQREAIHYVVSVDLGGVKGAVAPLVGQQPPDTHVWISSGEAPAFLRMEGPFFEDGPIWRIEMVNPTWPDLPYERAMK